MPNDVLAAAHSTLRGRQNPLRMKLIPLSNIRLDGCQPIKIVTLSQNADAAYTGNGQHGKRYSDAQMLQIGM